MAVSRVIMMIWGRYVREQLSQAGVTIMLEFVYVDDLRYVISLLSRHMTWDEAKKRWNDDRIRDETEEKRKKKLTIDWCKKTLRWKKVEDGEQDVNEVAEPEKHEREEMIEKDEEDVDLEQAKKHTRTEVAKLMNSVYTFINFTTEVEEDYEDQYMPTLYLKIRMMEDTKQITYRFFEKEMANPQCINRHSAMSYQSRQSVLSQEILRRMLNTSEEESQLLEMESLISLTQR